MAAEIIEDKTLWDDFVDENPYGLLYHRWDFLKLAEKYSGYKLRPYGVFKGEELLGIYPLFYKRTNGMKTIFSPPPGRSIPYLGFLVSGEYDKLKQSKKESFLNSFLEDVELEIKKYSPDFMLIYTVPNFLDMRFFKWNNYFVAPEFTYVLNLKMPLEEIWNSFHKDLRRDIKQADSFGLEIKTSNDLSIFYERQEKRFREKAASFSINLNYFQDLFDAFPDNLKIYYIYDDKGEAIAASISQEYKGRFLGWMGLAKTAGHANEFMIWKLIELAKSKNLAKFEIAGANVRAQCQFKSKFNPCLELSYHIRRRNALGKVAEWTYGNLYKGHTAQLKKAKP
jgi:hypothetical protein